MRIELHIDRVILDGLSFSPHQAEAIRAALESELSQRWQESPPKLFSGATPTLATPSLSVEQNPSPDQFGRDLAGALHGGLSS
jgi:hypothetical protein